MVEAIQDPQQMISQTLESLRERMLEELKRMDDDPALQAASSEQRLKYMGTYFKTLQGVEAMVSEMREKSETGTTKRIDVVEFRRQLEMQIEKLASEEVEPDISGASECGNTGASEK